MSRRVPCESATCDSTSSEFPYPPHQTMSSSSSHSAVEHSDGDLDLIKSEFSDSQSMDSDITKSIDMDKYPPTSQEKGPDSTFPESLQTAQTIGYTLPPSYSFVGPLGSNNVQSYGSAAPGVAPAQQRAINKLYPVWDLPVNILGSVTLFQMSIRLDPEMLPSQNWRMMAEYMQFTNWEIKMFEGEKLKTQAVIETWGRMGYRTIGELVTIIHDTMNRPDVITDIPDYVLSDAQRHRSSSRRSMGAEPPPITPSRSESFPSFHDPVFPSHDPMSENFQIIEKPNAPNRSNPVQVPEIHTSLQVEKYDAFVLCNMADKDFVVNKFLPIVEDKHGLKLCLADRNIPPGNLTFPDQMDFMFKRSKKLVVILSEEFFESKEHEWQSNLAISQDPASRQQRIIPVKYKKITQRHIFDHLGCCDLTKTMKDDWFWNKIINGIKPGTIET